MKKIKDKTNTFFKNVGAKIPFKFDGVSKWINQNKTLSIALLLGIAAFLSGYYLKGFIFAATVNGKPVSRWSVIKRLERYQGMETLESIITEELIRQEAKEKDIKITSAELDLEINNIENNIKSQGNDLDDLLEQQGMTRKDLRDNIEINKIVERILTDSSPVTDEDVQEYIDNNSEAFPEGTDMEQVKTIVRQQLTQEKLGSQYQTWVESVRAKAKINIIADYK